jgi:hypothetical protein
MLDNVTGGAGRKPVVSSGITGTGTTTEQLFANAARDIKREIRSANRNDGGANQWMPLLAVAALSQRRQQNNVVVAGHGGYSSYWSA